MFTITFDAKPGDSLSNDHWDDRFTCPNCHAEHRLQGSTEQARFVRCERGARLRCELEMIESCRCTVADPDEIEDDD